MTSTRTSATSATSISLWPVPTVSIRMMSLPAASSASITRTAAGDSPPRWPRLASERMNTPSSSSVAVMRMRSPRMAPPDTGLEGSTAMMPTVLPWARTWLGVGVDQRRLARPRRPREADHQCVPQVRLHGLQQARRGGRQPLQLGDRARDGAPLARAHALDQAGQVGEVLRLWGLLGVRHGVPDTGPIARAQWPGPVSPQAAAITRMWGAQGYLRRRARVSPDACMTALVARSRLRELRSGQDDCDFNAH